MKITQKVKWIDARTKLPEHGQTVFCIQDPTKTATRKPLISVFYDGKFCVPYLDSYKEFQPVITSKWTDIIYWMPFPKTPKELSE